MPGTTRPLQTTLLLLSLSGMAGCQATNEATREITGLSKITEAKRAELAAFQRGEVVFSDKPYYGSYVQPDVGSQNGKALPKKVEGAASISMNARSLNFRTIADQLEHQTGLQITLRRTYTDPEGNLVSMPIGERITLSHKGALSKALDKLADRTDTVWSFNGTTIEFNRMITRTYDVPFPRATGGVSTNMQGVSNNGNTITFTRNQNEQDDPSAAFLERVTGLIAHPALGVFDETTNQLTVFGPPSVQARVDDVVEEYQKIYGQQIGLEIGIYFVDRNKLDDFETAFAGTLVRGLRGAPATLAATSITDALSGAGVATLTRGDDSFSLKAISRNAAVVDFKQISSIVQSGMWVPVSTRNQRNYVKSTKSDVQDGVVSTTLDTDTINTGIAINARPTMTREGNIKLSLSMMQSTLASLDTFQATNSSVQLPSIDERVLQNEVVLTPGDTMILSGFEWDYSSSDQQGVGSPKIWPFGGSSNAGTRSVRMIIVARPSIIPVRGRS